MHYCVFVLLPKDADLDDLDSAVHDQLAPFDENDPDNNGVPRHWDWYQIGGRWTGYLDENYDPRKDPANLRDGAVAWPTDWVRFKGDIMKARRLLEKTSSTDKKYLPFAIVDLDGEWKEQNTFGDWVDGEYVPLSDDERAARELEWELTAQDILSEAADKDAFIVVVDCHS